MGKKLLTWSIVFRVFHVSCVLIRLVLKSDFASGIKDVTLPNEKVVILVNMNVYMLKMAILCRIHGWFYPFKEVKKNAMKDSAEIILGRAHFRVWTQTFW